MDHFELMRGLIIGGGILLVLLSGSFLYDLYAGDDVCSTTGYVYTSFYGFNARCVYSEYEYVLDIHPSYSPSRGGMRG